MNKKRIAHKAITLGRRKGLCKPVLVVRFLPSLMRIKTDIMRTLSPEMKRVFNELTNRRVFKLLIPHVHKHNFVNLSNYRSSTLNDETTQSEAKIFNKLMTMLNEYAKERPEHCGMIACDLKSILRKAKVPTDEYDLATSSHTKD